MPALWLTGLAMQYLQTEHGGNLEEAISQFGGAMDDWLDISTGINRQPYPADVKLVSELNALPRRSKIQSLCDAALNSCDANAPVTVISGVQSVIQILPRLFPKSKVAHIWPSYNEYPKNFSRLGWEVDTFSNFNETNGADITIVVNPNNPTGEVWTPDEILDLAKSVKFLIIDESFIECSEVSSIASYLHAQSNILLLRSFGKFYGLAGLRLGFAIGNETIINAIQNELGPWPVSGLACAVGKQALLDKAWKKKTYARLSAEKTIMDALADKQNWSLVGGTGLFRLYEVPNASDVQNLLAQSQIWSRIFSYSDSWIRLGIPGSKKEWAKLSEALS